MKSEMTDKHLRHSIFFRKNESRRGERRGRGFFFHPITNICRVWVVLKGVTKQTKQTRGRENLHHTDLITLNDFI